MALRRIQGNEHSQFTCGTSDSAAHTFIPPGNNSFPLGNDSLCFVAIVTHDIEKAFQKQQGIFQNAKVAGKKSVKNNRWYKEVGLGFKTPREAIEGHYIDK
ncbi:hypothetical protein BGZ72_009497, partial [Mortierella alpina]